jgi:hypothetical protein
MPMQPPPPIPALPARFRASAQAERASQPQARLLEQAVIGSRPSFPNRPAIMATALLAGLILGVAAAMVTETMQGTVRNADDVEVLLGLRFIASVPRLGKEMVTGDGVRCMPADTLLRPMSAFAEAYRAIRSSIRRHEGESTAWSPLHRRARARRPARSRWPA